MKLIDVFNMLAERKIKKGTKLIIVASSGKEYEYEYAIDIFDGHWSFVDDYDRGISYRFDITADMLQYEARLMEPKNIKYYLKLDAEDDDSYVACDFYDPDSNWFLGSKAGVYFSGLKAKFTQEEINGSTLLKFVEKYGVKEEAKDDEDEAKND